MIDATSINVISIHAPREGGDHIQPACGLAGAISIHAPREGGDNHSYYIAGVNSPFQSTPPARGATVNARRAHPPKSPFQSTPPARGATLITIRLP